MNEPNYHTLLRKYLDGTATEAERQRVERWYAEANVVGQDDESPADLRARQARNWLALQDRLRRKTIRPLYQRPAFWYRVAAALLLVSGLTWVLLRSSTALPDQPVLTAALRPATLVNTGAQPHTYQLPDGSRVELQPGSRLTLAGSFTGSERRVELAGEATFAVARDTSRPFLVYGNGVVTRVLGTQFTVQAVPGKPTAEVSVLEGRVAVYRQARPAEADRLILTPNERATYTLASGQLRKGLVDEPVLLSTQQTPPPTFEFDDTPLEAAFAQLERAYNVDIVYDADRLRHCTVTASLTDQPLHTKLRMICTSVGADYSVQGAQLIVTGGGCP